MNEQTKTTLEMILQRKPDEADEKIFDMMTEMGQSDEKQSPVKFSVDFGKRCFEMGHKAGMDHERAGLADRK